MSRRDDVYAAAAKAAYIMNDSATSFGAGP